MMCPQAKCLIPLAIPLIVAWKMIRVHRPFSFVLCTGPLTQKLALPAVNADGSRSGLYQNFFVHICLIYAIISIIKADMEIA